MIQALIGDGWHQVEILARRKHGVVVIWRKRELFVDFARIRWISDDWYEVQRRKVA